MCLLAAEKTPLAALVAEKPFLTRKLGKINKIQEELLKAGYGNVY